MKKHDYLICVDSDGCAVDTMDIKHKRCFGPCMIREWRLDAWEKPILERWNEINLYSLTRGINRFKGLAMMLKEISGSYTLVEGIDSFVTWTEHAPELSNPALEKKIREMEQEIPVPTDTEIFRKALSWSKAVNTAIDELPWEEKRAFGGVKEAFEAVKSFADIAIVSAANKSAVLEEWERFGLLPLVDIMMCQEVGSKAYCIKTMLEEGYAADHILMVGDAPGDLDAAKINDVFFYPILVRHEQESWREFPAAAAIFHEGSFTPYEQKRIEAFYTNLCK